MDTAGWNALLDNSYGATRGPHSPDSFDVAFLAAADLASELPSVTEVDGVDVANGYGRVTLDNDDWLDAVDAVKTSSVVLEFGPPTAAWETARFVVLLDSLTGDRFSPFLPIDEPLTVTGAGSPVTTRVSVAAGGVFDG